ncbi:MAG: protein kinase [Thermoanaerobaculia bacterium]
MSPQPHVPLTIGRYRLTGEIGRGAMGAVYRAHDPQLSRDVAVKLISLALAAGHGDPKEAAARFSREARVAARLQHPNVVAVYDAGEESEQLYLVMELVPGDTLGQRLARGDFPETVEALEIVAQTADALAAAHVAGIIHRDVKPGNMLLTPTGQVKVSDFGVAKAVGESTELTRTGTMVGSPAYMAPEQVQGFELDGRSDLFSLGVVLYEMLLHRKPFPADTLTTLVFQILHQDPFESEAVVSRLHPDLADFLRWSLAKERDVRVPDARTFAARARTLAALFAHPAARGGASPAGVSTGPTIVMPATGRGAPGGPERVPLPPPSYATSAPTEIVRRPRSADGKRWALIAGLFLVAGALAIGLAMRRPAPPPDLSHAKTGDATATPPATDAAARIPLPTATAPPNPAVDAGTQPVGQRLEQATAPVPTRPHGAAAASGGSGVSGPAAPAPAETMATSRPEVAIVPEPPPRISGTFQCRKGAEFHVEPEDLLVTIDGKTLGIADDWDGSGGGKSYIFPGPGEYIAQFTLKGYRTAWVKIVVTPAAKRDIVDIDTELEESE